MNRDSHKTKEQLVSELAELRRESKQREEMLLDANHQLQDTNRQLQTIEDQLRAVNQKLEVNEQMLKKQTIDLEERVKELNCLHVIMESINKKTSIDEILQDVANIMQLSWQYPELARGKVTLDGKEYVSQIFEETEWKQSADIVVGGDVRGAVEVYYLDEVNELNEDFFLKEELKLINSIAKLINEAFERKLAEQALKKSEEKLRTILENGTNAIYSHTVDHEVTYVSPQFETLFGYTPEEAKKKWTEFTSDNPINAIGLEYTQKAIDTAKAQPPYELELIHKNGNKVFVEVHESPVVENGKTVALVGAIANITERKLAEEALRESEEKLRNIFENGTNVIYSHTTDHVVTYVSPQIEDLLGYTPEEAKKKWIEFVSDNPINKKGFEYTQKAIETGKTQAAYELEFIHKNGNKVFVEAHESPVVENGKTVAIVGAFNDLTERKLAERLIQEKVQEIEIQNKKLYKSQFQLDETSKMAKVGGWEIDYFGNTLHWTSETFRIHELSERKLPTVEEAILFYHPDDRQMVRDCVDAAINNGAEYDFQARIITAKNNLKWIRSIGQPILENGVSVGMRGMIQDITEQKHTETLLKNNEARYRSLYEYAPLSYQSLDADGKFIDINPTWLSTLGYKREEVIGKRFADFLHSDWKAQFDKNFPAFKERGYVSDVQFKIKHKLGHYLDIAFEGCVGTHPDGSFKQTYCVFKDISAQKQAEKELKQHNEVLLKINKFSLELTMLSLDDPIEELVARRTKEISGAEVAIFSEYNSDERTITTKHVEMEPGLLKKAVGLIGKQISKVKSVVSEELYLEMTSEIIGVRKTINEMSFGAISGKVGSAVQKLFNVDHFVGIAYLIEGELYGTSLLAMKKGKADLQREILENLAFLIAVSLRRRKAEEALAKNQQYLSKAQEIGNLGTWELDLLKDKLHWTKQNYKNFGLEYGTELNYEVFLNCVHPDDRHFVNTKFTAALNGEPYDIEHRIIKNGEVNWLREKADVTFDKSGRAVSAIGFTQDITERKKMELDLIKAKVNAEQNELKFRALYDNSPDMFVSVSLETAKIILCNNTFLNKTGYAREEVIGTSIFKIYHQDVFDDAKQTFESFKREGKISGKELIIAKKNGDKIYVSLNSDSIRDANGKILYSMSSWRDISEDIKRRKEQLRDQRLIRLQASLIEQVDSAIVTVDLNNIILSWNKHAEVLYQWKESEAIGKDISTLLAPKEFRSQTKQIFEHINKEGHWEGQYQVRRKDGTTIPAHIVNNYLKDENGKSIGIIGISRDITEQLKYEQELLNAKEKAEESDRLKSAFLSNMSHEIRTPMNGILGFTDLLKEPQLSGEKMKQYIQIIEKSGARMLSTINDIIDISRIEAGQVEVVKTEVSLNKILEEQYEFFCNEAESKGLDLIYKPSLSSKESNIFTDQHKLEGILTNLLKNAIKFTKQGSVRFGCVLKKEKESQHLEFFVQDSGIGIPSSRIDAIFNRFEQADIEDARVYQGSGLGLAISKSYAEMLGGTLLVSSEENAGSTFTFTIPYNQPYANEMNALGADQKEVHKPFLDLSVLVAEDDEISKLFLEKILEGNFKNITYVSNGKETLRSCIDNPDTDIILMDIKMPGMNGYDTTREIRKYNRDVIIIAQTAFGLSGDREIALNAGCDDYISKPINKKLLFEKIHTCLDKRLMTS